MTHPLDRPIWNALNGRQAGFASGSALAKRYPADVSPFAAARDQSAEAVAALAALAMDNEIIQMEIAPPEAPGGIVETRAACVQMISKGLTASKARDAVIEPLGEADAPAMLELATLTRPGPFKARTHTFGRFIGVKDQGRLVAMCGERLGFDGFTEATALCTHPDYRGRGLGDLLLRTVSQRLLDEGQTPFLHAYAANTGAIELYRRMGFEVRIEGVVAAWKRG